MPKLSQAQPTRPKAPRDPDGRPRVAPPTKSTFRGYVESFGAAIVLALVFRQFALQAFRIPSSSMEDTLLVGDFLFVNKFLFGAPIPFTQARLPKVRDPKRGDIIVFKSPSTGQDFIKRCVAVAGDTLEVRDRKLYVNRMEQADPFVKHQNDIGSQVRKDDPRFYFGPVVVPQGRLFMMGDNRENSSDSRYWGFLPLENIKGKAMFIYFSTDLARGYPISFHIPWPYEGYFPPRIRFTRTGRIIH